MLKTDYCLVKKINSPNTEALSLRFSLSWYLELFGQKMHAVLSDSFISPMNCEHWEEGRAGVIYLTGWESWFTAEACCCCVVQHQARWDLETNSSAPTFAWHYCLGRWNLKGFFVLANPKTICWLFLIISSPPLSLSHLFFFFPSPFSSLPLPSPRRKEIFVEKSEALANKGLNWRQAHWFVEICQRLSGWLHICLRNNSYLYSARTAGQALAIWRSSASLRGFLVGIPNDSPTTHWGEGEIFSTLLMRDRAFDHFHSALTWPEV